MQNNNCQGVVDGGGRRTMLWFLPMLIVIFGTANQVVSEKMKFYENVLMVSSTVYRTELQATSHCSCRVKCIIDKDCTAISVKRDDATGIVDCFFSSETKLKKDHFEDDETTNTWIKQSSSSGTGLPNDPSGSAYPKSITTKASGTALPTDAGNTAITGQTSGTDSQPSSPNGQTSSPNGQTSSPNGQTSSPNGQTTAMSDQSTTGSSQNTATTTTVTTTASNITTPTPTTTDATTTSTPTMTTTIASTITTTTPTTTIASTITTPTLTTTMATTTTEPTTNLIVCSGTDADKDGCFFLGDEAAGLGTLQKCWDKGGMLFTAYTNEEFASVRTFLKITSETKSDFKSDLLVSVFEQKWIDRLSWDRDVETDEWVNNQKPPKSKSCAYVKEGEDFALEGVTCQTEKKILCRKQVCTKWLNVKETVDDVMLCSPTTWADAHVSCWRQGGMLYNAYISENLNKLIKMLTEKDNYIFMNNMWIGVKSDTWINSIQTTDDVWDNSQLRIEMNGEKCGAMEKNKRFKFKSYDCEDKKDVLCKKVACKSGYILVPGVGCLNTVGSKTRNQQTEDACKKDKGTIYAPSWNGEFEFLLRYLTDNPDDTFNQDMWVDVKIDSATKTGEWTNGDPVMAEHWEEDPTAPVKNKQYCGYLRKDKGYLLMESACDKQKPMLCKLPLVPSGNSGSKTRPNPIKELMDKILG